jgi:hypothetical protein
MDQSDNVDTTYLLIDGKKLAQNTPENKKANPNAEELTNGSDNALINEFVAPALGCQPFQVSSITAPSGKSPSLATNELQANFFPPASGPALVPLNDDFAVINNNGKITQSLAKTNLYRAAVGQPLAKDAANASSTSYCQQFAASGLFIHQNQGLLGGQPSPATSVGSNLFTFLAQRFQASFGPVPALGCTTIFGVDNPVKLSISNQGVTTGAVFNDKVLSDILSGKIKPAGAAAAATQAATSASASQSAAVLKHGTKQHQHKGHNNIVPNQAGRTAPSVTPDPKAATQVATATATAAATAAASVAGVASSKQDAAAIDSTGVAGTLAQAVVQSATCVSATVTVTVAAQTVTVTQAAETVTVTATVTAGGAVGGARKNVSSRSVNTDSAAQTAVSPTLSVSAQAPKQSLISSATPTPIPCNGGTAGAPNVYARRHPRAFQARIDNQRL